MIRLGLCCTFLEQPIKFRNTTVKAISAMKRDAALAKISTLCMANADALLASLQFCADKDIGCFRINSQILPVRTHAECGYEVSHLPDGDEIVRRFEACGEFARDHNIRTCFHPDQFIVLNSPRLDVVERSLAELEYQAEVAQWVGADVVNIHGGGAYGDKSAALMQFAKSLARLSDRARSRLTVENDDVTYTPSDLLPLCRAEGIPLIYDVHHHRCHPDELSIEQATQQAIATWNREPMFHLSSPLEGWQGPKPNRHHDYINIVDFPECWRDLSLTVEVEAKAKEVAVLKLMKQLSQQWLVYMLRCADGSLYTGITNDLGRRIEQHNAGTASRYTRSRLPAVLVYQEPQANQSRAIKRELAIKALSRERKESLVSLMKERKLMPRKDHWNTVYTTKANDEVSWFEVDPTISLDLIQQVSPPPKSVIDVGGGQSFLVDRLLDIGIDQVAVLDISSVALDRTKERLGERAAQVEWIEADVTSISDVGACDLWHDRAVFHFLTEPKDRAAYLELAAKSIPVGGHLISGTFAIDGPEKCSGLPVCRYDAESMASTLGERFSLVHSQNYRHRTPSDKEQRFFFGIFQRV